MNTQEDYLTGSQLAREVGLSSARIRQLAIAGQLPFVVTPLGRLFDRRCIQLIEDERRERELTRERKRGS